MDFECLAAIATCTRSLELLRMRYGVIGFTLLFLALAEVGLEVRAHLRGWNTLLIPDRPVAPAAGEAPEAFGPSREFPFRSAPVDDAGTTIWIASASYAQDDFLPPDRIFPHLIQEELGGDGRVQILNAARAGNDIAANVELLAGTGPRWDPDLVLLYSMSLDIEVLTEEFVVGKARADAGATTNSVLGILPHISRLAEQTTSYALLKANMTSVVAGQKLLAETLPPEADAGFVEMLDGFVSTVESIGAVPVLATFALSARPGERLSLADRSFILRWNQHLAPDAWVGAVDRLNEVIRTYAVDHHVALLDIAPRMTGRPDLYRDLVHFNVAGHREMARVLAEGLAALVGSVADDAGAPTGEGSP